MTEFRASDAEVRQIAEVFARCGWRWGGLGDAEYVPTATDIARSLSELWETALWHITDHHKECETCENGDREFCGDRPRSGRAGSGRLFVEWSDEGYGPEPSFGIEWTRLPAVFADLPPYEPVEEEDAAP